MRSRVVLLEADAHAVHERVDAGDAITGFGCKQGAKPLVAENVVGAHGVFASHKEHPLD